MPTPTGLTNIRYSGQGEDNTVGTLGGTMRRYLAGATLLVGDIVYISGVNTVNKSATAANYVGLIGVVVSGGSLDINDTDQVLGATAATSGQQVLVQEDGVARCIVGASGFTAGTNFNAVPSAATAGRVIPGTTADQRIGTVLTTQATAGAEVRVLLSRF